MLIVTILLTLLIAALSAWLPGRLCRRGVTRADLWAGPGVVLGVGACLVQQHFGLIEIPAESFLTKSYPVEFRPGDLAAVLAAFAAVALLLTGLTVRGMIKRYD